MTFSRIFLCRQDEIVDGSARGFDPHAQGRDTLLVVRWRGVVRAWLNRCPHMDVAMQYRKDRFMSGDGQHIVCFAHGALFRPDDGLCVLGPCVGQTLHQQPIVIDEGGAVWLMDTPAQPLTA